MLTKAPKKIAVIHDWLVSHRGGEKVLEAILELFPSADLFTLYHTKGSVSPAIESHAITTSHLNRIPFFKKFHRHTLPFMPGAIERFNLEAYDLVISSSHCVAKGVIPNPSALHICYCYTPMRYAWDRFSDYFQGAKAMVARPVMHRLRIWDVASSHRVDHFMAISHWIEARIHRYYRRDSEVVFPFIDQKYLEVPFRTPKDYYLVAGGFAPYKRIDLALRACSALERKLIVVGAGQDEKKLKRIADPKYVEFAGRVPDATLMKLYAESRAFLFPGEEDFGIAPLESLACGRPVIAFGRGGACDTIISEKTGIFFDEQTVKGLSEAMLRFEAIKPEFSPDTCRTQARRFLKSNFQMDFLRLIDQWWKEHQNSEPKKKTSRLPEKSSEEASPLHI